MGEGKGTLSTEDDDVQSANDGGDVSNVDADCKLDPDIAVDECGYPTIIGSILMSQVAVDEDGYPTIFGSIFKGDGEFEDVNVDSMECDEGLPYIQPINPNVRARKLEVNGVATAKVEEDVANGVAPPIKKAVKKKTLEKKTLKAKMIQQWHPSDTHAAEASKGQRNKRVPKRGKPTEPKAKEEDPACRKGMKYADALTLSAHGSCNAAT